ncbi:putative WRKY transcription factor 12 [Ranunculus cassubicifolius]
MEADPRTSSGCYDSHAEMGFVHQFEENHHAAGLGFFVSPPIISQPHNCHELSVPFNTNISPINNSNTTNLGCNQGGALNSKFGKDGGNGGAAILNDGNDSWWRSSSSEKSKMKVRRKLREPRFCFQTRSDIDVLDDGYKWRKYGQKVVKNSLHPRSYYRCTYNNCRVKKRVERLSEDCRMVITTYEGRHTHSPCDDSNSSEHEGFGSF